MKRCGKCENCRRVAAVQAQGLKALAQADVKRASGNPTYTVGEDVRLIWNRALEENPCTSPRVGGHFSPADSKAHEQGNRGYDVTDLCRNCGTDFMEHANGQCPEGERNAGTTDET